MKNTQSLTAVGLMSGTSADGIDAALVTVTRDPRNVALAHFATYPFSESLRRRVLAAAAGNADPAALCALDAALGKAFGEAVTRLLTEVGAGTGVDVVASHGQTVWHAPGADPGASLQLGSPAHLAAVCGLPVVADFRNPDLAQGGQGAPLTPLFHHVLFAHPSVDRAVVNLGGIANVSLLPAGAGPEAATALDTGPANMVIDGLVAHLSGGAERMDRDGARGAAGTVHEGLLGELLKHPYFALPGPKSTGREMFGNPYLESLLRRATALGLGNNDLIATATALTARTVADRVAGAEVLLCGGGARNRTLVGMLRDALPGARVETAQDHGLDGDAIEAMAFAELGCRHLWREPGNLPRVTGARRAVVLGSFTPAPC